MFVSNRFEILSLSILGRITCLLFFILIFGLSQPSQAGEVSKVSGYMLGVGDLVHIEVYGEDDLAIEAHLNDAGSISYPFLGEINVLGLTVGQLERLIRTGLKGDYLIDPRVTVIVIEYRKFFINGEVKRPGGYSFEPGLSLQKAIAMAGGFTERASKSDIYVRHENAEQPEAIKINLHAPVYPGDIITIEQSFF